MCEPLLLVARDAEQQRAYFRRYYAANRERLLQYQRDYRAQHPDLIVERRVRYNRENKDEIRQRGREYYSKFKERVLAREARARVERPERFREAYRRYRKKNNLRLTAQRFGVSTEEISALWERGRCDICGRSDERLGIDHCHETKRVRGLLCTSCNLALGKFRDDPAVMLRAVEYVLEGGAPHAAADPSNDTQGSTFPARRFGSRNTGA